MYKTTLAVHVNRYCTFFFFYLANTIGNHYDWQKPQTCKPPMEINEESQLSFLLPFFMCSFTDFWKNSHQWPDQTNSFTNATNMG